MCNAINEMGSDRGTGKGLGDTVRFDDLWLALAIRMSFGIFGYSRPRQFWL